MRGHWARWLSSSRLTPHASRITHHVSRITHHVPSPPAAEPPKTEPKEKRAAAIDACRVAELVSQAGIVLRIDCDVFSEEQIGHGHGHQRALHHATAESSRTMAALQGRRNAVEGP